jgi:hypothetical protein
MKSVRPSATMSFQMAMSGWPRNAARISTQWVGMGSDR